MLKKLSSEQFRLMLSAAAAGVACACAPFAQEQNDVSAVGDRDCFNVRSVSGYSSVDDDTLRLSVGASRHYEVDYTGPLCDQITWSHQIALEARPSSWICVGGAVNQAEIHFRDATTRHTVQCYVQGVRRVVEPAPEGASD